MTTDNTLETIQKIRAAFKEAALHRPLRENCYDAGDRLVYNLKAVASGTTGRVHLVVANFVGGGFAGQVYRVKVEDIVGASGPVGGIVTGGTYAMKILIPPSGFSRMFRNALYWVGFQGPFQLQVNPYAARAGALWQKFIRRGARIRFGDERVVADIHATFIDERLGSCGELSEWVEGRTWKLETDEHLDQLRRWKRGRETDPKRLGSPEYRSKRMFMADFVGLLHDMGGQEFARQYDWSTCKSQPNCLKRLDTEDTPDRGLVAIDFRAGLALLPFLPMSPGDFKLIFKGLTRGSLVQFDRGDLNRLSRFIADHSEDFGDMHLMLEELKQAEQIYRNSVPDITHNHLRLIYSRQLWSTIFSSAVTGWRIKNKVDGTTEEKLRASKIRAVLFFLIGVMPFLGGFFQKLWGRTDWRKHYRSMFTEKDYFRRAVRGRVAEKLMGWVRSDRVSCERAPGMAEKPGRYFRHLPFSVLPAGLHRFLTDWAVAKKRLSDLIVRPVRLYFNAALREQWLQDMLNEGKNKRLLSTEDAKTIQSQIKDPFIQKYLKSLAVHVCTLPVTQVVSVIVAAIFWVMNPEMSTAARSVAVAGILVAFQITPVSPGSLVRGLYVLYLVIKERNFKDYNIAVFLGFFKYIGYLAFPIQMTHRYPTLARFMAGYWATEAVHVVPVFGENGALLEHGVYCLFYNKPLTIRRRIQARNDFRVRFAPRYWHIGVCALLGAAVFGLTDLFWIKTNAAFPGLKDIWPLVMCVPLAGGGIVSLGAGGASLGKRIISAVVCGLGTGLLSTAATTVLAPLDGIFSPADMIIRGVWGLFLFSILSAMGAILTELKLPEPKKKK